MDTLFKLFESEKLDRQILIIKENNDEGNPNIYVKFDCDEIGAVASIGLGYKDTVEGYELRDTKFNEIDITKAEEIVASFLNDVNSKLADLEDEEE